MWAIVMIMMEEEPPSLSCLELEDDGSPFYPDGVGQEFLKELCSSLHLESS